MKNIRRFFSILAFMCFVLMTFAQNDRHSFLVKGRSWHGFYQLKDVDAMHF